MLSPSAENYTKYIIKMIHLSSYCIISCLLHTLLTSAAKYIWVISTFIKIKKCSFKTLYIGK